MSELVRLGRQGLKARLRRLAMWRADAECWAPSRRRAEVLDRIERLRREVLVECGRRAGS